jgi:hypothetical protein
MGGRPEVNAAHGDQAIVRKTADDQCDLAGVRGLQGRGYRTDVLRAARPVQITQVSRFKITKT